MVIQGVSLGGLTLLPPSLDIICSLIEPFTYWANKIKCGDHYDHHGHRLLLSICNILSSLPSSSAESPPLRGSAHEDDYGTYGWFSLWKLWIIGFHDNCYHCSFPSVRVPWPFSWYVVEPIVGSFSGWMAVRSIDNMIPITFNAHQLSLSSFRWLLQFL